jgi:heat shock protein HtpX
MSSSNRFLILIFFCSLAATMLAFSYAWGGLRGIPYGFAVFLLSSGTLLLLADQILINAHGAERIRLGDEMGAIAIVGRFSQRAAISTPSVFVIPDPSPNAFSIGHAGSRAAIVVSRGLLTSLSPLELEAVLAHEMVRIQNGDAFLAGIISAFLSFLYLPVKHLEALSQKSGWVRPILFLYSSTVWPAFAFSNFLGQWDTRDGRADVLAANMCGRPEALAAALQKISSLSRGAPLRASTPATTHLYTVSGGSVAQPWFGGALDTRSGTYHRIQRLLQKTT